MENYRHHKNLILKENSIIITKIYDVEREQEICRINKANFNTDEEAEQMAIHIVESLEKNIKNFLG